MPTMAKCNAGLVGLWNVFRDASAKTSFDELYLKKVNSQKLVWLCFVR
jgi:hypothetical protein